MKNLIAAITLLLSSPGVFAETTNLIPFQTPAKDQGPSDLCAFYATTALFESALKISFGKDYDISEKFEAHRSKIIHKQRPEVEFGDTYLLLQNFEKDMYFETEEGRRVLYRGFKYKLLTKMWDSRPWSTIIAEQLKQNHGVVITLKVTPSQIDDKTGIFTYNQELDQKCLNQEITCGGHAVLLVGYNSEKKLFVFKNSWGPKWGENGFGFATAEHIDNFSDQPVTGYFDQSIYPLLHDK